MGRSRLVSHDTRFAVIQWLGAFEATLARDHYYSMRVRELDFDLNGASLLHDKVWRGFWLHFGWRCIEISVSRGVRGFASNGVSTFAIFGG